VALLAAIGWEVKKLLADARDCLAGDILPALAREGIELLEYSALSAEQRLRAETYFQKTVFPVLTPLAFDPGRPFPHISNLSLNLAVTIRDPQGDERFARLKVPDSLPQLVPVSHLRELNGGRSAETFVWLEQVIAANVGTLFQGMEVLEVYPFHVTRDADIAIKELDAEDLLETIEESVRQRRFGSVVRLEVSENMPPPILKILMQNLEVVSSQVYRGDGHLSLSRLMQLYKLNRPELKDPPFSPALPEPLAKAADDEDVFAVIRRQDVLLHHPYDSFQAVVDLLRRAARDPQVQAIKMVLYRVGRNSPVVEALLDAVEQGKQVAVLVELKARFDEESNIEWARALEREGVHVVYGLVGLKTHCKLLLVVRREQDTIRRYLHMATGNYNVVTAQIYTDLGLLTCLEEYGADATNLFNYLTGYSAFRDYRKLLVSPVTLRERFEALIRRETEHARQGRPARLCFKMNALEDPRMIQLLYEASQAGVSVDLIVRGICCLRPGIPGLSEKIRVISVVGRFLEHSRVYYFGNAGREEIYIGSADLMPRNLDRRVEVLFPLDDAAIIRQVKEEILDKYLADTAKCHLMQSDGSYIRRQPDKDEAVFSAQAWFLGRTR
jgi:polyphosphate kinase